jgi:hypothetical protein
MLSVGSYTLVWPDLEAQKGRWPPYMFLRGFTPALYFHFFVGQTWTWGGFVIEEVSGGRIWIYFQSQHFLGFTTLARLDVARKRSLTFRSVSDMWRSKSYNLWWNMWMWFFETTAFQQWLLIENLIIICFCISLVDVYINLVFWFADSSIWILLLITLIVILESIMKKDNLSTLPNMFFSNANCATAGDNNHTTEKTCTK